MEPSTLNNSSRLGYPNTFELQEKFKNENVELPSSSDEENPPAQDIEKVRNTARNALDKSEKESASVDNNTSNTSLLARIRRFFTTSHPSPNDMKVQATFASKSKPSVSPITLHLIRAFDPEGEQMNIKDIEEFDKLITPVLFEFGEEVTFVNDTLRINSMRGLDILIEKILKPNMNIVYLDLAAFGERIPSLTKLANSLKDTNIKTLSLSGKVTNEEAQALVLAMKERKGFTVAPYSFENFIAIIPKLRDIGFLKEAYVYCDSAMQLFGEDPEKMKYLLVSRGKLFKKIDRTDLAEKDFLDSYKLDNKFYPACVELYCLYSSIYDSLCEQKNGEVIWNNKAIHWGELALKTTSTTSQKADALFNVSIAYSKDLTLEKFNSYAKAKDCLTQLLLIDPKYENAQLILDEVSRCLAIYNHK